MIVKGSLDELERQCLTWNEAIANSNVSFLTLKHTVFGYFLN